MRTLKPISVFLAAVLIYIALGAGAAITRAPWWDEGVFGDIAQSVASTGRLASLCMDDDGFVPFPKNRHYIYWQFPGYLLMIGFWSKLFGLSILGIRLFSLMIGIGGLFAWRYMLRDTLRDDWIASWMVLLIAVDYGYQTSASNGRMDMLCHATGIASIALAIWYLHRPSTERALASGAALAVCLTSHPIAIIYCMLFVWHLWIRRAQCSGITISHAIAFVVPSVLAFGAWAFYATQNWEIFKVQLLGSTSYRVGGSRNPFTVLYLDFRDRYWQKFEVPKRVDFLKVPVLVVYVIAGLAPWFIASIRRRQGASTLLAMQVLALVTLAYVDNQRFPMYFIHTLPVLLGPIVLTAEWMWQSRWVLARPLSIVLLGGVFGVSASMTLWKIKINTWDSGFNPTVAYLRSVLLPGALVMGGSELGFGIGFTKQFEDDRHLGFFTGRVPTYFVEHKAHYVIHTDRPQSGAAREHRERMLREQYQVVFENSHYRIYRHKA
jgi:hypothetical protein